MSRLQAIILLLAVVLCATTPCIGGSHSKYNHTIYVVQHGDGNHHDTCSSFECIGDFLSDSMEVQFDVPIFPVTTTLIIRDVTNIALRGTEQGTTFYCNTMANNNLGIQAIGVTDLTIMNIKFINCGSNYTYPTMKEYTGTFIAAVHILHSVNCTIKNVVFSNSNGRGLLFLETRGEVTVEGAKFEYNHFKVNRNIHPRGGGVFIQVNSSENSAATYTFNNCSFLGNDARDSVLPYGEGGGILVKFESTTLHNHIRIYSSQFIANLAKWGGALHVIFYNQANHNSFIVKDTIFKDNRAPQMVGGAVGIGYRFLGSSEVPLNNSALFYNCTFINNRATYGGGVSIFSSKSFGCHETRDKLAFLNCTWDHNFADFGSAVDVSPEVKSTLSDGWIPLLPIFKDCQFINNALSLDTPVGEQQDSWKQYAIGRGALHVTSFTIVLSGELIFHNNTHSAICLVGSRADFSTETYATFSNNSGFNGGAIAMNGFSALRVKENSQFVFSNNIAERNGGAIYFSSIDKHDFVSARSCFIQYRGSKSSAKEHNITFWFQHNQALNGHSIYASTLHPCRYYCKVEKNKLLPLPNEVFGCIANLSFEDYSRGNVSTLGWQIKVLQEGPLQVAPGMKTSLPIELKDELDNTVDGLYHAKVVSPQQSTIRLDKSYSYIYNGYIKIYGRPGDTGLIELSTLTSRKVVLVIEVKMLQCPPGFIIGNEEDSDEILYQCVCSINSNESYVGIQRCNMLNHTAYIQRQYWIGYNREKYDHLLTGWCPSIGLCKDHYASEYPLPNATSKDELYQEVCSSNRTGTLCSRCQHEYTVHYHATTATCHYDIHCRLGWLLYILSELVPLTVLFMVVMVFNINFTSGSANAFILFAQIFHLGLITAHSSIWIIAPMYHILRIAHFIYRFFNMELFTIDSLSFCLWKGAQSLDMIAFKYVTIIYSLLLIALTVVVMNICNIYRLLHAVSNPSQVRGYIIHGLTTFLILCYSQCTKVTMEILTPAYLYGEGGSFKALVVKHDGDIAYFSSAHLRYAIPAIIVLFTVVLPPPLLLFVYPAHYKLLRLLRISETKFAGLISPEKLKPLFDSFQGCYKDDYRFFAGLYFLFRLLSELTLASCSIADDYFTVMEILLALMIMLHMICRPYHKNWHNILDSMIFLILLLLCILTMYTSRLHGRKHAHIGPVQVLQTILSLLPFAYIVVYVTVKSSRYIAKQRASTVIEMESLPARIVPELDSDSSDVENSEYHLYSEDTV